MDELLKSPHRDQQGGPFDYHFDEEKAAKILKELKEFLPLSVRGEATCKCDDPYCPHKCTLSPLVLYFINKKLNECLIPQKTLFTALKCDEYEIIDNKESNYNPISAKQRIYDRQRVKYEIEHSSMKGGKTKNKDKYPSIHRGILELIEGVEFINSKVKFVYFMFNGQNVIVPVKNNDEEKKIFVKCPFLIILKCLQYVQLKIEFHDSDNNDLGYDFDSWLIGGTIQYDLINNIKDTCIEFKDEYNNEIGCVSYTRGMIRISSEQCYHGGCSIIPNIVLKKRENELMNIMKKE